MVWRGQRSRDRLWVYVVDQIWNWGSFTGRSQNGGKYIREILTPFIGPWVAIW